MKTLAVIVTHNRCSLLERCLDHLLSQTLPPTEIFVVNNASTDGTTAMLDRKGITYTTQPNLGSAGGWYCGIQKAIDGRFDAVWLMDDDGYPDARAHEILQQFLRGDVVCASSVVVCQENPDRFVFPFPLLGKSGLPVLFAFPRKITDVDRLLHYADGGVYPFAHFFNGALVLVDAVKRVGNVNRDYFMFGDEVDYYFRLCRVGKVISIINAVHYHPDVSKRPYTPAKVYYFVKNTFIINRQYMNLAGIRNVLAVVAVLGRTMQRNGLFSTLDYIAGKHRHILSNAVKRGLHGQIGKDFDE